MSETAFAGEHPPSGGRGRSRRGLRKGDHREATILETAKRLLGEQPAASITVEQLAAGAGISRSSLYFYFESRDAVLRAVVGDVAATLRPVIAAFIDSDQPADVRVRSFVGSYLQRWRDQGHVLRAMHEFVTAEPALGAQWADAGSESVRLVADMIDAEQRAGRALPAPPAAIDLAHALTAMLWRAGYETSLAEEWTTDHDRITETLTSACLRVVYGDASPR